MSRVDLERDDDQRHLRADDIVDRSRHSRRNGGSRSGVVSIAQPRRGAGAGSAAAAPMLARPGSGAGSSSRSEPPHDPAAALLVVAHEDQPVVQPVGAALPELDPLRDDPVAAPDRRPRHRARRRLLVEQAHPLLELLAGVDHGRLDGGDGGQLGAARPGVPEGVGGGVADPLDRAARPAPAAGSRATGRPAPRAG